LLQVAQFIRYDFLTTAVEAVIQIGGTDIYPYLTSTMDRLFVLCDEYIASDSSNDASHILYSMFEIVNAIPDDAALLEELCDECLPKCIALLLSYPSLQCFSDIFLFISAFTSKIDKKRPVMFECCSYVLNQTIVDEVVMTAMRELAFMICPLIVSSGFTESGILELTIASVRRFLEFTLKENDIDDHGYALLICGCLFLGVGEMATEFIPVIVNSIGLVKEREAGGDILFSACVFAVSSWFMTCGKTCVFPDEVIRELIERIGFECLRTYKELKMGFLLLLKFAEMGAVDAFEKAATLLPYLAELKMEHETDLVSKMKTAEEVNGFGEADFPPLIIPFDLPQIDAVNEFDWFRSILTEKSFESRLSSEQMLIIRKLFNN
jgi:hypothetical protein